MSDAAPRTCPTCSRSVEPGFKFCDYCGTRLDDQAPPPTEAPADAPAPRTEEPAGDAVAESDVAVPKPPLLERWRERRQERKRDKARAAGAVPLVDELPVTPADSPPLTPAAPAGPTSGIKRAEELRSVGGQPRAGISGRLQWREDDPGDESEPAIAPAAPATWRRVEQERTSRLGSLVAFVVHLAVSFVAGALLLGTAAAVAAFASHGRVALLEERGVPIFIAGASAIVIFALLRTSPRRSARTPVVAVGVVAGLVILIAAVAVTYRPSVMADAESRMERAMGLFGPSVTSGVNSFAADLDQWNTEVGQYRDEYLITFAGVRAKEKDAAKYAKAKRTFEVDASGSEEALDSLLKQMRSDAKGISHAPIGEALDDLAGVFEDQLSGIKLITRGMINNDQGLVGAGDERFKEATRRASELFDSRVRPLLERGGIDADSLDVAVNGIAGG